MTPRKPALVFIFFTLLLDVLGFGLLIPVGPKLVEELMGAGEEEAAPVVALLLSSYYFMMFVCAPMLGVLSDRFGRRPVILISLFGSGVDFFAQALAPTVGWLFVTRAINGLTGASFSVAMAYVADLANAAGAEDRATAERSAPGSAAARDAATRDSRRRAGGFGMIYAAFGLGFIIGPVLGGVLGSIDIRLPFYVAGCLTLLNWLYGFFVLPESLPRALRRPVRLARANPVGALGTIARYPAVLGLAGWLFLFNLAQFGLHATWVLYTTHRYQWEEWQVGLSLTVVGIGAAVVQGGLARRIVPRLGERRAMIVGSVVGVLAYIGYGLAPAGWMIYVVAGLASLGGIAQPAVQAMITRAVRPDEQGTVQGALSSLSSMAGILGPLVGGTVFAYFISDRAPVAMPGASFFVCGAMAFVGLVIGAVATARHARREAAAAEPGGQAGDAGLSGRAAVEADGAERSAG